jgi:hypothetical protein
VTIRLSTGSESNLDLSRTPKFNEIKRWAQIQPMSQADISMTSSLNISGLHRHIWINGQVEGLVRGEQKGGDFVFTPDGRCWKIAYVTEAWPDWCSAFMTLQVGK